MPHSSGATTTKVVLLGKLVDRSDLGNIMYGAVAKMCLYGEALILGGANAIGTSGPNSKEDMASVVAGLELGKSFPSVDLARFCAAMTGDHSLYIASLQQLFSNGSNPFNLLGSLGTNLLEDMSITHNCDGAVKVTYSGSHSTFAHVVQPSQLAGGDDDWGLVYPNMGINWPRLSCSVVRFRR